MFRLQIIQLTYNQKRGMGKQSKDFIQESSITTSHTYVW